MTEQNTDDGVYKRKMASIRRIDAIDPIPKTSA